MKVILEFNLPEDKDEHTLAQHGSSFYRTLWNLDSYLRSVHKYDTDIDKIGGDEAWHIRKKIIELMDNEGISFNIVD